MRKNKMISVLLVLLLSVGTCVAFPMEARASSLTSEVIKDKEDQIDQIKKDMDGLKSGLSDLKKIKEDLEKSKNDLKSYVATLDQNLAEMEQKILDLKGQITIKENEIDETAKELGIAEEEAQDQYDYMVASIRYFYEAETFPSLWELLFSAKNIGDFLNRLDYMNRVYEYDRRVWEEYQLNCDYIELCKEQLELEKELLDEQKENVETQQAQVEELIEEKSRQILAYESDIANKEQTIEEYEQMIDDQNALIAELEKQIEAEKEKLRRYDGGIFKFPLASYTRVSDDYGMRIHPTLGVEQFHNGVDLAAPKGTAIYAAYDGEVVAATYSSSMGNYVMINHGDGLYTIYMHASALYVSAGQEVARGDTIAAVGSTGRSTGPHLHFSVRKNGNYVSPWDYISK